MLKNVRAMYEQMVIAIVHDLIHNVITPYVDNVIVKSHELKDHIATLRAFFYCIKKLKPRLNPQKCLFGAASAKLLRFVISDNGI